jgi:hypothetical protein
MHVECPLDGYLSMRTAAEYGRNAAECLRLARVAQSVKERDILSEIAQTWATLAEQAEQLEQLNADKNRSGRRAVISRQ